MARDRPSRIDGRTSRQLVVRPPSARITARAAKPSACASSAFSKPDADARSRRARRPSAGRAAGSADRRATETRTARIASRVTPAPTSTKVSSWWTSKVTGVTSLREQGRRRRSLSGRATVPGMSTHPTSDPSAPGASRLAVATRADVPPFHVMDLLAAAARRQRTHGDVLNLLAGQPAPVRPGRCATRRCGCSSRATRSATRPPTGILELREAIAAHHRRMHGVEVEPRRGGRDDRLAAAGSCSRSSPRSRSATGWRWRGRATPATATCSPRSAARSSRSTAGPETRFQPTVEQVAALPHGHRCQRGWSSPARPTRPARCCRPTELAALARWCEAARRAADQRRDLPRHRVRRARRPRAARPQRVGDLAARRWCSARSRKYFSMTGWRIGWMLVPERLRRRGRRADRQLHDLPAGARPARRLAAFDDASYAELDGHVRALRRQPRGCCSRACRGSASTGSRRPTARSTCTPTSGT